MDVDREGLQAHISQPTPAWPVPQARPVMPVLSVEDRLRRRRALAIGRMLLAILLDALMITVAFRTAYSIRYQLLHGITFGPSGFADFPFTRFLRLEIIVTVGLLIAFFFRGLYRLRPTGTLLKQCSLVIAATSAGFAIFAAYEFVFRSTGNDVFQTRLLVALTWGTTIATVSFGRLLVALSVGAAHRRGVGMTNLLVVGSGRLGKLMMQHVAASPHLGYHVVGFVQDMDGPPTDFGRFKVLGTMTELDSIIRGHHVVEVIIALPSHQHHQILRPISTSSVSRALTWMRSKGCR